MTITTQQKAGCELAAPQVEGGEASIMAATNAAFTNSEEKCTIPLISHEDIALNLASKNSKSFHTYFETSQSFTLLNDDLRVLVSGYQVDKVGTLLYRLLGFITLGTAFLLGKWFPKFPIRLGARPSLLTTASFVVITDQHGQFTKVPIEIRTYDGDFEQLFYSQSTCSDTKGFSLGHSGSIRLFQYRFMIFVLNPETGVFHQLSQWQDNRWAHISRWHEGLDADELKARKTIFPTNVVDIPERPILALLTDEVLHPFVMFQVFSIILWCIEKYYKYAVAIAIITSFSVVMTLIQTRSNFKRVQKLSRFECTVNVFRGGTWGTVSSSELVPGDLLDIAHPELDVFPCDSVLIQGDCIVGEGMLTGESVPVSKSPLDRPQLLFEELGANQRGLSNFSPALSRSMLFSGTQLIRARGGFAPPSVGRGREFRAVAMVIRTGFNTTKGGLVRSILFPKPTQFKFYRDPSFSSPSVR
ncbi:hypothetical protein L0F63_006933 [Massospora cicadina]|nr:hypothetical protein L0F63_006933 [Massospora cicadina]